MKFLQKSLLTVALLSSATNIFSAPLARVYNLDNFTDMDIVVKIRPWGSTTGKEDFQIIRSGESVKQVWDGLNAGLCISSLQWAKWPGTNAEINKWVDKQGRIPANKQAGFAKQWRKAMLPIEVLMVSNEAFQKTLKATGQLGGGIDDLGCQILKTAMAAQTGGASEAVSGAAKNTGGAVEVVGAGDASGGISGGIKVTGDSWEISGSKNTSGGTKAGLTSTNVQCSWGIKKLLKGAGNIAGGTMCKSREFIIVYKLDANGNIVRNPQMMNMPVLQAITVVGE